MEVKFGLVFGTLAEADRQLAAELVFDEGGFVAASLCKPGVNAQGGEVTWLTFRPARRSKKVLRLVAGGIWDAVQLKPSEGTNVGGGRAFAHGIRQIQLNEARNDPSRNRDGLIAGLRGSGQSVPVAGWVGARVIALGLPDQAQ